MTNSTGTVDITNVVNALQDAFDVWGANYLFIDIVSTPGLQWLALPVFRDLLRALLKYILSKISGSVILGAFFLNTAIKKPSQAQDLIEAWNQKISLPEDVDNETYAEAERLQMSAFRNFVMLSN